MKIKHFLLALSIVSAFSCVSSKKFNKLQFERDQLKYNYDQLLQVNAENKQLLIKIDSLEHLVDKLNTEIKHSKESAASAQLAFDDVTKRYNKLVEQNKSITNASSQERNKFITELNEKDQLLTQRERQLDSLSAVLNSKQKALDLATINLQEREQKLKDLQQILDEKDQNLAGLQNKLKAALSGFSANDLTIVQKDGKLYATLSQDLLFASGSKQIDLKGVDALKKFGNVLKNYPDVEITVEGHTDTDGSEDLNWNLSADRAIAVTKVLITEGVDAKRIIPSGRAFYLPVAPNETKEGKSKNRRTEIILSPKLTALYNLINQ
ncbi:MAG: OmpA family protein [Saprospiraceae bacterium]|jgi:chemotaxis protein MotB|nr:OmpA family protein [Saprospiraceae bacterium]